LPQGLKVSRPWLALTLVLFCLPLFFGLRSLDLETDEAIYSFAVDRILEDGQWLQPKSSPGETAVFLEKPPLKFWIVAAPIRAGLLPHDEFGLRFWDALMGAIAFAYVFAGSGTFCNASEPLAVPTEGVGWWPHATPPAEVDNRALVLFDRGDEVVVQGGVNGVRFLLVSGQPLQEPVAWYGPIVMNTQAELRQAFDELERGTFLKPDQR